MSSDSLPDDSYTKRFGYLLHFGHPRFGFVPVNHGVQGKDCKTLSILLPWDALLSERGEELSIQSKRIKRRQFDLYTVWNQYLLR